MEVVLRKQRESARFAESRKHYRRFDFFAAFFFLATFFFFAIGFKLLERLNFSTRMRHKSFLRATFSLLCHSMREIGFFYEYMWISQEKEMSRTKTNLK